MNHVAATAESPECIHMAKSWLQGCLDNHANCGQRRPDGEVDPRPLPDRVLYVGADRDPFIFCNSDGRTVAPYAALSHRWGGHIRLQLIKDNLKDFTRRIPLLDFPQSFKDAITICRALNIQYLWIDSLCIVQDSRQDWEEQSAKMGTVYSDAHVTIAADAAENSEVGFIHGNREAVRSQVWQLSSTHQIFARPKKDSFDGGFVSHLNLGTRTSWLADRGWTFQEKVLSPRILHFTESELSWECASASRCECHEPHPNDEDDLPRAVLRRDLESTSGWAKITRQYTRRHLTFEGDKLAALAGLAAQAQASRPGARYLAGLWGHELPHCLAWYSADRSSCRRARHTTAPSWSWACLRGGGGIDGLFGVDTGRPGALRDIVVGYPAVGSNPYGSLPAGRRATLTATAELCDCRVVGLDLPGVDVEYPALQLEGEGEEQDQQHHPGHDDGSEPMTDGFAPDTAEDWEVVKAEGRAVLMRVNELNDYLVLRRLGGCDCTFQRVGFYHNIGDPVGPRGKFRERRITII